MLDAALVVPDPDRSELVVPAPGPGPRRWVGAPSAQLDVDGTFVIAYRVRDAAAGIAQNVVARWAPGVPPTTLCTLDRAEFDAHSLERPAIVRLDADVAPVRVLCEPVVAGEQAVVDRGTRIRRSLGVRRRFASRGVP